VAIDKAEQDTLNDKNTIVIIPPFGQEQVIATKWLRRNASKVISEQRVFTELYLSSLQTDITIVVVARDYSNPIKLVEIDNAGNMHYPNRPDPELEEEVEVTTPVKVSKYWTRENPMRPGKPDIAAMLEQLGKETSPWRLEYTDKGAEKPEIMQLVKS
jgi:hypothetical protein